jgi:hypothetical protein
MISHQHRCVFVHIPKVAGQSIERVFLGLQGLTWEARAPLLLRFNPDPTFGPERLAHLTAVEYVSCGHLEKATFQPYFKFSFIRNPFERLVSEYRWRGLARSMSFRNFVTHYFPRPHAYADSSRHVLPQYDFLYDSGGRLLMDFVGRFENLQQDFDCVCQRLGISGSQLPHANPSPETLSNTAMHYSHHYDGNDLVDHVARLYEKDLSVFGYRFEDKRRSGNLTLRTGPQRKC